MWTFLLLSFLVLVHELGHFLVAKKFGVRVEEFGFGLPPKLKTLFYRGETEYTLNWLPIGGFVRLLGEDMEVAERDSLSTKLKKQAFFSQPIWQRALILLAGIAMNLLVGTLLFAVVYGVTGIPKSSGERVLITRVVKGSPAELAGIKEGEVVKRVNDEVIGSVDRFVEVIKEHQGELVSVYVAELQSDGRVADTSRQVNLIPRENPPEGEGSLGVEITSYPIIEYEKKVWYLAPVWGLVEGVKEAYGWSSYMIQMFAHPRELWQGVGGPVKVVQMGQKQVEAGWLAFLRFGGVIAFNLAIFNLLPLPALDGGRVLFLLVEMVVRDKKKLAQIERYVHMAGMVMLIGLLVVVTIKDLV